MSQAPGAEFGTTNRQTGETVRSPSERDINKVIEEHEEMEQRQPRGMSLGTQLKIAGALIAIIVILILLVIIIYKGAGFFNNIGKGIGTGITTVGNTIKSVAQMGCYDPRYPNNIAGLCYANCNLGYERRPDAPYLCQKSCPPGTKYSGIGTCVKETKTVPMGTIPGECPSDKPNKKTGLCYGECPTGYNDTGATCLKAGCPGGFRDDGLSCWSDSVVGRTVGHGSQAKCQNATGGQKCVKSGLLWYLDCNALPGGPWVNTGLFCQRKGRLNCPDGYYNGPADQNICWKKSINNPGVVPKCPGDSVNHAGLCYKKLPGSPPGKICPNGFEFTGSTCIATCPSGYKDFGVGCSTDTEQSGPRPMIPKPGEAQSAQITPVAEHFTTDDPRSL